MPEPTPEKCPSCNCSYEILNAVEMPAVGGHREKMPPELERVDCPPAPLVDLSLVSVQVVPESDEPKPKIVLSLKGKGAVSAFKKLMKENDGQLIFIITDEEAPESDGDDSWNLMSMPLG